MTGLRIFQFLMAALSGLVISSLAVNPGLMYSNWSWMSLVPVGFTLSLVLADARKKSLARTEAQKKLDQEHKDEALPVVTVPPVTAGGPDPTGYLSGITLAVRQEPEYVPAGQAELSANLLEVIKAEVEEHGGELREYQSHYPSYRWFMSPEWLEEVRKVRTNGAPGRLVFVPRERSSRSRFAGSLYGYPVTTGSGFGVPELRAP